MEIKVDITSGTVTLDASGTYTADQLRELLKQVGQARAQIAKDPANPTGHEILAINSDSLAYWTEYPVNGGSLVAMRHPGFGWLGMLLTTVEAARLAKYLNEHVVAALTLAASTAAAESSPPSATHSGGGTIH